jgi:DNA-binding HxlR family transcriptional regulator
MYYCIVTLFTTLHKEKIVTEQTRLPVWCGGEEWCPVTSTATLIGRKWHPVIVERLLDDGPMGFSELKEAVDGISSKVLSDVVEDLEQKELLDRAIISEKPFRVQYSLTDRGADLRPVIEAMDRWGRDHLQSASDEEESIV